ncbi:MAG: hypothetical protein AAFO95_05670 [Cyanobacteria bacterium J06600_6]
MNSFKYKLMLRRTATTLLARWEKLAAPIVYKSSSEVERENVGS